MTVFFTNLFHCAYVLFLEDNLVADFISDRHQF